MREPYENLANAIVELAIIDYKKAKAHKRYEIVEECERFFDSEWFSLLTGIDINYIKRRL